MKVFIALHAGFCEGVSRAYSIAQKAEGKIYMLGNLVHNKQVVERLTGRGIKKVKGVSQIPAGILLVSAHGISPEIYEEAKAKGLRIIDTTCAWVKKAQKLAKDSVEKGYQLIIVGDKDHPEVKGLIGWSNNQGIVVSSVCELNHIKLAGRVAVIAQTTQSESNFSEVLSFLQKRVSDLIAHNTICGATEKRQRAAVELAQKVDLMLVIGDRKSANTKRLTELCKKTGTATRQIQTREEFRKEFLKGKEKIGVTAGASTPDWVIKEVIAAIKR